MSKTNVGSRKLKNEGLAIKINRSTTSLCWCATGDTIGVHSGLANAVWQILIFSTKLFPNVRSYVSRKPPKAFGFLTFYFRSNRRFSKTRIWVITQFLPNFPNSISKKIDFLMKMSLFLKSERCGDQALYILIYYILIGKKWHITLNHRTVPFGVKRHLVFFPPIYYIKIHF